MAIVVRFLFISLTLCFMGSSLQASEVLVYRNESMPWCGTVDARDAGIAVDILNAVTKHGGPTFKFESMPWKRAQKMVLENQGTAIIPFTRTQAREQNHT